MWRKELLRQSDRRIEANFLNGSTVRILVEFRRKSGFLGSPVVLPTGFEPMAPRLGIWCSILLSYGRSAIPIRNGAAIGNQLSFSGGGVTGKGSGITAMPSSRRSLACSIVV